MDFALTKEQQDLESRVTRFAAAEITPHVKKLEDDIDARLALFRRLAQEGLYTLILSDTLSYLIAMKALSKADGGIAVAVGVTNMVAEAIARFGTQQQQADYLPRIANGTCVPLAFALTEKHAGSDIKNIEATYKEDPDPNYLLINGSKHYITNGDLCQMMVVFAKKQGDASGAITAFLIDQPTTGLSVVKKENKLGLLTAHLVALKFENCRIPKTAQLGKTGEGLKIALSSLDSGRLGIAAQSMGIAEAAYEAALKFSQERLQFGHPIGENQAISFKLADMRVKIDAGTLLMYRGGWTKQLGQPFTLAAAEAKLYCSEACNEIAADALQIHGACGYIKDYPVEKYFRDARVTTIYEGTSEIQRIVISRHLGKV